MLIRCKLWTSLVLVETYSQALQDAGFDVLEGTEYVYWDVEASGQRTPGDGRGIWNTAAQMAQKRINENLVNVVRLYAKEIGPKEVPLSEFLAYKSVKFYG